MGLIKLENINKSYGNIKAVDNLNLTVNKGDIYGFIGPNGAGKSTTIRLLLNFLSPDSGNISLFGLSPSNMEVEIKKRTGYVSSETFMYPDMKILDLFRFTEYFHKIDAGSRIKKLVEILDIDTGKRFEQLSFGNRKKVSIACALLHSPELIILDEPTNGLDPVIRMNLYELLKQEQNEGATIFYSSHVLSEVQQFCSKIGLIKDGKLIKESSAADFTNVGYTKVIVESENVIDFSSLKGVAGLNQTAQTSSFIYSGNLNELLYVLNVSPIKALHIAEPEIEDIFIHYFK